MLRESWSETYTRELGGDVAATMVASLASNDLGGLVPDKDEQVLIATQDDQIVGSVISAARHGVIYLWGCYVLQRFQRQGIGRKLLLNSVSTYDPNDKMQLTVLQSSEGAVQFYKSMGFKTISEEPFELLPGLVVPSLTMAAPSCDLITS
jgi:ribosomal protein S18 acetylase RimI-like enzyme